MGWGYCHVWSSRQIFSLFPISTDLYGEEDEVCKLHNYKTRHSVVYQSQISLSSFIFFSSLSPWCTLVLDSGSHGSTALYREHIIIIIIRQSTGHLRHQNRLCCKISNWGGWWKNQNSLFISWLQYAFKCYADLVDKHMCKVLRNGFFVFMFLIVLKTLYIIFMKVSI